MANYLAKGCTKRKSNRSLLLRLGGEAGVGERIGLITKVMLWLWTSGWVARQGLGNGFGCQLGYCSAEVSWANAQPLDHMPAEH